MTNNKCNGCDGTGAIHCPIAAWGPPDQARASCVMIADQDRVATNARMDAAMDGTTQPYVKDAQWTIYYLRGCDGSGRDNGNLAEELLFAIQDGKSVTVPPGLRIVGILKDGGRGTMKNRRMSLTRAVVYTVAVVAATFLALACLTGCAWFDPAAPHTRITIHPWTGKLEYSDTKDNDVVIKGLRYDPESREFTLEEFSYENKASSVMAMQIEMMRVNVAQMEAFAVQQQAGNDGIRIGFEGLTKLTTATGAAIPTVAAEIPGVASVAIEASSPEVSHAEGP